jgi:hypothetical protein
MKRLTLLLLLMMAPGLNGESVALSNQAAAAGASSERLGARPVYAYGTEHQINALDEKRLLPAGPTNEVEVKRLKLMFLLMMSLGQHRIPGH